MNGAVGLTRESSETIGFVLSSLFCSAIDLDELKEWCYQVIGELDAGEAPAYLFDLVGYSGALAKLDQLLGFVPSWEHSDEDEDALIGIAMKRGKTAYEWPIEKGAALAALARRPAIEDRFRKTFSFIAF